MVERYSTEISNSIGDFIELLLVTVLREEVDKNKDFTNSELGLIKYKKVLVEKLVEKDLDKLIYEYLREEREDIYGIYQNSGISKINKVFEDIYYEHSEELYKANDNFYEALIVARDEIEAFKKEVDRQVKIIKKNEADIESFKERVSDFEDAIKRKNLELKEKIALIEEKDECIEKNKKTIISLNYNIENLKQDNKSKDDEISTLNENIFALEKNIKVTEKALKNIENEKETIKEKIGVLNNQNNHLIRRVDTLKSENVDLKKNSDEQKLKIENLTKEQKESLRSLINEESSNQKVQELKDEIISLQRGNELLTQRNKVLMNSQEMKQSDRIEDLIREKNESDKKARNAREKLLLAKKEVKELKDKNNLMIDSDNNKLQIEINVKEKVILAKDREITMTKKQVEILKEQAVQNERKSMLDKTHLTELEREIENVKVDARNKQSIILELQQKEQRIEKSYKSQSNDLLRIQREFLEVKGDIKNKDMRISVLSTELMDIKQKKQKEIEELEKKLGDFKEKEIKQQERVNKDELIKDLNLKLIASDYYDSIRCIQVFGTRIRYANSRSEGKKIEGILNGFLSKQSKVKNISISTSIYKDLSIKVEKIKLIAELVEESLHGIDELYQYLKDSEIEREVYKAKERLFKIKENLKRGIE